MNPLAKRIARISAAALAVGVAATGSDLAWGAAHRADAALATQQAAITRLETRVATLEGLAAAQPDWPKIAAQVEPSVLVIRAGSELGSGWVVRAAESGSDIVTNFHVVASVWDSGSAKVDVVARDRTVPGEVAKVDPADDLALVHVDVRFPALSRAGGRPKPGDAVMAVGAPLGLADSVSIGLVSGFRSLDGADYMQFSAAISPGNSGGPVVDRAGWVVAVASAKFVGDGVEALSLGIPVQTVCLSLGVCGSPAAR